MPNIDVTMPQVDKAVRIALAKELTSAFSNATGLEAEILGISFREYQPGMAAEGGQIIDDPGEGPVHIQIASPRLARLKKRDAVENLTAAFRQVTDWKSPPVIHITEHPYDNVGVGGKLLSDVFPELSKIPFYYSLKE